MMTTMKSMMIVMAILKDNGDDDDEKSCCLLLQFLPWALLKPFWAEFSALVLHPPAHPVTVVVMIMMMEIGMTLMKIWLMVLT